MKIAPTQSGSYSISCPVTLENADGVNIDAKLYVGGGCVRTGDGEAQVAFSDTTAPDGILTGHLHSSDKKTDGCVVSSYDPSASVAFEWDCAGDYDFTCPAFFVPGVGDTVEFYPTLDEVGGNGAIDGHDIEFYTYSARLYWYTYDLVTGEEDSGFAPVFFSDGYADMPFGLSITTLVEHTATSEIAQGVYQNTQTVNDYYDIDGDLFRVVEVDVYDYATWDQDVYR